MQLCLSFLKANVPTSNHHIMLGGWAEFPRTHVDVTFLSLQLRLPTSGLLPTQGTPGPHILVEMSPFVFFS